MTNTTPIQETWQEDFEKLYGTRDEICGKVMRFESEKVALVDHYDQLKDFIKSLLQRKERETIKRVMEVMPTPDNRPDEDFESAGFLLGEANSYELGRKDARNQALQEWTDNINKLK